MNAPPGFVLLAAAVALPWLPLGARRWLTVVAPLAALPLMYGLPLGSSWVATGLQFEFVWARRDELSQLFGLVFLVATVAANVYGWGRERVGEQVAGLVYAGGGLAVVFAGDLLTLLIAWEVTAVSSTFVVAASRTPASIAAALRYLLVHFAAGSALLIGVLLLASASGSFAFGRLPLEGAGAWLVFFAFCLNAAVPPLHAWLPDAYPESTPSGAVLLSAFTTKAAVYCLLRGFPGEEALVWIGAVMALYGVLFALLENNIRRLLSYHMVSQVGYMVCGVGVGSAMALDGAAAHAFCNILYKGLLFMAAGALLQATGTQKLTELGGLARATPSTLVLYMIGALAISGVPPLNGFVSKSMVTTAVAEAHRQGPALLLLLASVGTLLSVGLKLPYYAWFARPPRPGVSEAPAPMLAGMTLLACLCIVLGVAPRGLYALLPFGGDGHAPYTWPHVFEVLLLCGGTGAAFWWLRARLAPHAGRTLDFDWLYRRLGIVVVERVAVPVFRLCQSLGAAFALVVRAIVAVSRNPPLLARRLLRGEIALDLPPYDPERQRPPLGAVVLWTMTLFAAVAAALLSGVAG